MELKRHILDINFPTSLSVIDNLKKYNLVIHLITTRMVGGVMKQKIEYNSWKEIDEYQSTMFTSGIQYQKTFHNIQEQREQRTE